MQANEDQVDAVVLEYLRATEAGEQPDLEALTSQIEDPGLRAEARELVATATWARGTFPAPLRPQVVVGMRYRLLEHLGSGGFGKVWRAHDEKLDRAVALKLFHPLLDADEVAATLLRERQALARVHHDGIVRLLDSGRHDDTQFLAMELVAGTPLDRVVTLLAAAGDAAFPPPRAAVEAAIAQPSPAGGASLIDDDWFVTAARIAVGVLWALSAAHSHGIVHRDLKPANVLLRGGGHPVLLDFGLAGLGERAGAMTSRLFGTAAYLAPEQLQRQRMGKEALTDVYQCGLLLYEMLTLRRAFGDEARSMLLTAVREGKFAAPRRVRPAVPAALEDVCLRALEREPSRRYATAEAFRADLERWLAGALPVASRLGPAGRLLRAVRTSVWRHRVAVLVVAALLSGGAATVLAMPSGPDMTWVVTADGEWTVTLSKPDLVTIWDRDGDRAAAPRQLFIDGAPVAVFATLLPAGEHRVKLGVPVDATATAPPVVVEPPAAEAVDWVEYGRVIGRLAAEKGRLLRLDELKAIADELNLPGRGAAPIGPLTLSSIFK